MLIGREPWQGKGGLKAATAVNVRHILCEKHSKATEALQRIQVRYTVHMHLLMLSYYNIFAAVSFGLLPSRQAGERFDKVAQECSEDKAKGILICSFHGVYSTLFL